MLNYELQAYNAYSLKNKVHILMIHWLTYTDFSLKKNTQIRCGCMYIFLYVYNLTLLFEKYIKTLDVVSKKKTISWFLKKKRLKKH